MIVQAYTPFRVVDMHVGRGHVPREARRVQPEDARLVGPPRPGQVVGIGQSDVAAVVVGEVEVVAAEWARDPVRDTDQRRAVDVVAHAGVHVGPDDRVGREAAHG